MPENMICITRIITALADLKIIRMISGSSDDFYMTV